MELELLRALILIANACDECPMRQGALWVVSKESFFRSVAYPTRNFYQND